jgi:hypothetical protein
VSSRPLTSGPRPVSFALTATLLCAACESPAPPPDFGTARAFVLTSDLTVGGYALVDEAQRTERGADLVHYDAVARVFDGLVYVVNRAGGDNIQVIDPAQGYRTVRQFSTGSGTNPQDIAVVSPERAYIPLYRSNASEPGTPDLLVVNPRTGEVLPPGIDLSAWADADGFPEPASALQVGETLLVSLQRLDRSSGFKAVNPSMLLRIDLATDQVIDTLTLAAPNPFGLLELAPDGRTVMVAEAGNFSTAGTLTADGALEAIDAVSLTGRVVAREVDLGGDVAAAAYDGERLYATLGVPTATGQRTDVVRIDPETGAVLERVFTPESWVVWDLEIDPAGTLWVTDRTYHASGLRLYPRTGEAMFIPFDPDLLPPMQVRFLP